MPSPFLRPSRVPHSPAKILAGPRPHRLALLLPFLATLLGAVLGARQSLPAQSEVIVCDSTLDAVIRLYDSDFDGALAVNEWAVYYDDSSPGPDLSAPSHLLAWNDGYLVADGGTIDAILRLRDTNGDGDANDAGEVNAFFDDTGAGPDLSVPSGMAIGADGALYVCDDGATVQAVIRLVDLDGNGDALAAGESLIFFGAASPLAPPALDPESVAAAPDGSIVVGDTATGRIIRLRDLDGDGTALGTGEATVVYDLSGAVPLTDIDALQVDPAGRIYAVDEDTGTVVRLSDPNGDGDSLDPAELLLFHDGLAPGALVGDPNDAILIGPAQLLVADGALDAVVLLEDLDGDGAALSPAETFIVYSGAGGILSTPHGLALPANPAPPPVVTIASVSPGTGDALGGSPVLVTGSGWSTAQAVTVDFGGVPVAASVLSATELGVMTPAHPPALVDVGVTTGGASAVLAGAYRFQHRFRRGDITLDGTIGLLDPILLLQHLFLAGSAEPPCRDAADTDDDGALELEDAIHTLGYLFAGGPPPAAPFPLPDFDPTPLGPGCETPGN